MKVIWVVAFIIGMMAAPIAGLASELIKEDGSYDQCVLDTTPPVSSMSSPRVYLIPEGGIQVMVVPTIKLIWQGTDLPIGGVIDHFDVEYRIWDMNTYTIPEEQMPYFGDWNPLYPNTTRRSGSFPVEADHAYSFRVRAVDQRGNAEDWPENDDCRAYVIGIPDRTFERLNEAVERISDVIGPVPKNATPVSRVLPTDPVHFANCYTDNGGSEVIMFPDIRLDAGVLSPVYCQGVMVEWRGVDPVGRGNLTYDVQYKRIYLEGRACYPEEDHDHPNMIPAETEWVDWISGTTDVRAFFWTSEGGLYLFRCRARDQEGNQEPYPLTPDACTLMLPLV